jgi:GNAT superfamily N-acetyltransferase
VAARVRSLQPEDLEWTAPLQREALPHGFFAGLGLPFLRAYQSTFLDSPFGIALAADADGSPVGFLVGAVDADAHRAWVLRHRRARLAALGVLGLLARPGAALRFVRTRARHYVRALARSGRRPRGSAEQPSLPVAAAVLTHVAVAPAQRRTGAGSLLVEAFVDEARRRGAGRARLTTLRDDTGAEGFWQALAWTPGRALPDDEHRLHRVFERKL